MSSEKSRSQKLPKLIVILGPTASGKTDLAIRLAKRFNGEIVSADSRQIYKEMNIGTAKPTKKERETILHHLIDIIRPGQEFNVALYKKMALLAFRDIQNRGKLPFLVGGTGLYIQAIVDNINFPEVPLQEKLREKLEKKSEKELFKIYNKFDPKGAKFIDKYNKRRLIRAIEVCKFTKKSFWKQRNKGDSLFNILRIGIRLPKKELEKRISKRIKKMFNLGLGKEVRRLVKKYGWIPPFQTIGYQEWKELFDRKINKKELKEKIKLHTLQFTKRQMTWFKRHPVPEQVRYGTGKKIHWVENYCGAEKLIGSFLQ